MNHTADNRALFPAASNLRDFFAGLTMHALINNSTPSSMTTEGVAKMAYAMADSMLKERAKDE